MVNLYKFVMKENVGWVKESDPDPVTYNKIGSESGQNIRICNPYLHILILCNIKIEMEL